MNLSTAQLELFCLVARVKSFSQAARLVHLTQPAVSLQVQALEEHFGVELFRRGHQGVELTPAGEVTYNYARQILELCESLEKHLESLSGKEEELVLGASSCLGNYALPCSLYAFRELHPAAHLRMEIGNRLRVLELLRENTIDLAIIEGPVPELPEGVLVREVARDNMVVIAPAAPPWTTRASIAVAELAAAPFIIREAGSGIRQAFEQALSAAGLNLAAFESVTELGSLDAIKSAVQAGLGVSIATRLAVRKEVHQKTLHALALEGIDHHLTYYLLYHPRRFQGPLARKFINFITSPAEQAFC